MFNVDGESPREWRVWKYGEKGIKKVNRQVNQLTYIKSPSTVTVVSL